MNDRAPTPTIDAAAPSVDAEHPWLGLASFTEETRAYFYGREEEIAELCRRVQRKLLTILFGQSGLGKTSILRAGVVPRLRPEGFCPVYVRLDYSPDSPLPSEQIKQAIFRATESSGQWTQVGVAEAGESLWEFLHHRDDILRDASGKTLIPLLIFDQFEELFTLAQSDEFGRRRAAQFIEDLADLVENRAPKALEAKMDEDESAVERFDFTRSDYRILIALREDYLAHLESLKTTMPSIAQNRMRLARMTGAQALSAVMKPGGKLVSEEVAGAIVRFVAGGAELPNAEVEPALLSLICRELNNARIAQGKSEISADLLAGSRDTILADFYERALADQPAGARQFIEDNLLTDSGHRESLAEERVLKGLAATGAKPDALALLVNRRLLRIEERLDVRRVELTHDVLCGVVRASRDVRLEREARDEAERKLAAQRERERATRRALMRARKIAMGCAVLAAVAAAGAVFGYFGMRRAQEAEQKAVETRRLAESARSEAEKLIVFLLDDFYLELEPVGRLDIVAELAKRAIDYYRGLPPELRTPETDRNRALALVRLGAVLRWQNNTDDAAVALNEAIEVLTRLRQQGDASETTAIGLALALVNNARNLDNQGRGADSVRIALDGAAVLQPMMTGAPSVALRRAYGTVMNFVGFAQMRNNDEETAVKSLEEGRTALRSIDNLALNDVAAAGLYTEVSAWQLGALRALGRVDDARRVGADAIDAASRILEKRPGNMQAMRSRGLLLSSLAETEDEAMNIRKANDLSEAAIRNWREFLRIDPSNAIALNNLAGGYGQMSGALYKLGRVGDAATAIRAGIDVRRDKGQSPFHASGLAGMSGFLSEVEADRGRRREAEAALADLGKFREVALKPVPPGKFERTTAEIFFDRFQGTLMMIDGDYAAARRWARERHQTAEKLATSSPGEERAKAFLLLQTQRRVAQASLRMRQYADAEADVRQAIAHRNSIPPRSLDEQREAMDDQILLAIAIARQGRRAEAQQVIAPALKFHRDLAARGGDDQTQRLQLAQALYASALAGGATERVALAEAARLIDGLSPELRALKSTELIRGDIAEEQKHRAG
jgi:tetratricopeptide (TPR) repeat protein